MEEFVKSLTKNLIFIAVLAYLGVNLGGCASTTQGGIVGEDSSQFMLVSSAAMNQSAAKQYAQVVSDAREKFILNTDKAMNSRVKNIASRLVRQVGVFRKGALDWHWEINIIQSDVMNAWCMPGGKIAVYSGIINKLSLTDGELAAIIGHEMAHALREHSRESASTAMITNLGVSVVSAVAGLGSLGADTLGAASKYALTLPFSRDHERQADAIGCELMARAGYNPFEAVSVWEKMSKNSETKMPEIMSTHPSHESRIEELKAIAKKLTPIYEKSKISK